MPSFLAAKKSDQWSKEKTGEVGCRIQRSSNLVRVIVLSVILLVAGIFYCLYYGRIGYMPQDSAAVFDGGWRILSGQIPFLDFTAPNAIVPILLQAISFSLFGVNWFAYCLHAAIFNGLFCVLAFLFLRMFGGTLTISFFYALISGVVYYTPFGIPFQDQHAFFFTFILIFLACFVTRVQNPSIKNTILFFLPALTAISFFSKQIPTIFGVILALCILLVLERSRLLAVIQFLFLGTVLTILMLWVVCIAFGIDFNLVDIYLFRLPAELGYSRITKVFTVSFQALLRHMLLLWKLFSPFVLVTLFILGVLIFFRSRLDIFRKGKDGEALNEGASFSYFPLLLSLSLIALSVVFLSLTNNQDENGAALIFVSLGLLHIFLNKSLGRKGLLLVGILLCGGSLLCAWNFHKYVNMTRMVHDLVYEKKLAKDFRNNMPEGLSFLVWATPERYKGTPEDFKNTIDFFSSNAGNFFLLGDSSILYALTGRPSVNPVLWFDPGQTMPFPSSLWFPDFQDLLLKSLIKNHVRYVVLEATRQKNGQGYTWSNISLAYFPKLNELVQKTGSVRAVFGVFTIIELVNIDKQ